MTEREIKDSLMMRHALMQRMISPLTRRRFALQVRMAHWSHVLQSTRIAANFAGSLTAPTSSLRIAITRSYVVIGGDRVQCCVGKLLQAAFFEVKKHDVG
jgi:hypothetical protein